MRTTQPGRISRDATYLWADKQVVKWLFANFPLPASAAIRFVYYVLCEIESDLREGTLEMECELDAVMHDFTGLSDEAVDTCLWALNQLELVKIDYDRDNCFLGEFALLEWDGPPSEDQVKKVERRMLNTFPKKVYSTIENSYAD